MSPFSSQPKTAMPACQTSERQDTLSQHPGAEEGDSEPATDVGLCWLLTGEQPLTAALCWSLAGIDEVVIGRDDTTVRRLDGRHLKIGIRDPFMSKCHVRLWRCPSGWAILDVGSKNGTLVNGVPCLRAALGDGDLITLGATFLQLAQIAERSPTSDDQTWTAPSFASFTPSVAAIHAKLAAIAPSDVPVLLLGETGVGKEVAARTIHELSGRGGAFVGVNCGALPATLLEATLFGHRRGAFTGAVDNRPGFVRSAQDGTLFLDEVSELTPAAQAALLRVLQEREVIAVGDTEPISVNARILAATNRDLSVEVSHGRFRDDLLARLAGLTVRLVPLRERRADLGLLLNALLTRIAPTPSTARIGRSAARLLVEYHWPRNVRELEMCLRTAGELAGWRQIERHHLPDAVTEVRAVPKREQLVALLQTHRGNLTAVARELKTSRMQVHRLLKQSALDPNTFRE